MTTAPSPDDKRPSDASKGSVLEALAAGCKLSLEQARVLAATGISTGDRGSLPHDRPWCADDDVLAYRLHRVRGWSPAAIAVFVNRPEAMVRAALARLPSATGVRKDTPPPV